MSKTPFMPLWVADFLGDTLDLDSAEVGAYLLLLMAQWQRGGNSLPDDEKKLQRVARCGRNWAKVWAAIERYFDRDEDGVFNKRLRFEAQNVAAKRDVNSQNGARGGTAKALKRKNAELANASNSLQRNPSIPEPEPKREDDDDGGDAREPTHAHTHEAPPPPAPPPEDRTFRESMLDAMGCDRSGLTGPSGRMIGGQADMLVAAGWIRDLGLTGEQIIVVIGETMARKRDPGPPSTFRFFTKAMQRFAADLADAARPIQQLPDRPVDPQTHRAARPTGPDLSAAMARLEAEGRA